MQSLSGPRNKARAHLVRPCVAPRNTWAEICIFKRENSVLSQSHMCDQMSLGAMGQAFWFAKRCLAQGRLALFCASLRPLRVFPDPQGIGQKRRNKLHWPDAVGGTGASPPSGPSKGRESAQDLGLA